MTASIVSFVLEKLVDAANSEVLSRHGINKKAVERVRNEFDFIQKFGKVREKMQYINGVRGSPWLDGVRDLAFEMEDCLDTLLTMEDENRELAHGKMEAVKRILRISGKPSSKSIRNKLNQMVSRLEEIFSKQKMDYITGSLIDPSEERSELIFGPRMVPRMPNIDSEVIGFTRDMDYIIQELLDETTPRRAVLSIVGARGIGKTTLAQKVFNSVKVKEQFDSRIWVSVSREFDSLFNFSSEVQMGMELVGLSGQENTEEYFLTEIQKSLRGKRYLLVLDDVWSDDIWGRIDLAFPDENNGSRVLVTTRFLNVAKVADPESEPYKLQSLTDKESLQLLLKKALPDCPDRIPGDLTDVGKQLVKKCGGSPLALVTLGSILSKKEPASEYWKNVLQSMTWDVDGRICSDIIASSYDDLPDPLKQCFMYLAAFPKKYEISAESLIRMWVAEGFIPLRFAEGFISLQLEERLTLEDTAKQFLEELAQREMIQVSRRSVDNSIMNFHVNEMLHGVAIQKAKDNDFIACSNNYNKHRYRSTCRVAIHDSNCDEVMKNVSPKVRTLLCFKYPIRDCSRYRTLKVLSCMGGGIIEGEMEFERLAGMTQLRYFELGLSGDPSKVLSHMKHLQTIDLRAGDHGDLPDCVWQVKTLRHVMLKGYTSGPTSSADLENLQTLTGIKNRESWRAGVPNIPNLRDLDIRLCQGSRWGAILTLLDTLKHLVYLNIVGNEIPLRVFGQRKFHFYKRLQYLSLREDRPFYSGKETALADGEFPKYLSQLILENLRLLQDPMPVLEKKVPFLKMLRLGYRSYVKEEMRCSAGGFERLRQLELFVLEKLKEWEIEEGAMPELQKLEVSCCPLLNVPQGLRHLTNLQELSWALHAKPAKEAEIRNFGKSIPSVSVTIVDLSK